MNKFHFIADHLKSLDTMHKIDFYHRLGFNLTIAIRSIWSNSAVNDKEKLEAIKIINELSHQVFNWLWRLRNGDNTFDDLSCFKDVGVYASQNALASGEIGNAIVNSYQFITERQLPR